MTGITRKLPPWLVGKIGQCSREAIRVYATMDFLGAYSAARAVTDKTMAARTGFAERAIIDLTGELLAAGLLIVASTRTPPGRWIVHPDDADALKLAREYRDNLRARASAIHGREGATGRAIALYDQHAHPADSTGQLALGLPAAADKPRWRDN